ncbi:WD40/YVTN repeat-like-containing domain superfamily, partial [Sesbania bispinosa]
HPITSIEWSPHEAPSLAVLSSDNQLTIWDLSLERDEEEEAEFKAKPKSRWIQHPYAFKYSEPPYHQMVLDAHDMQFSFQARHYKADISYGYCYPSLDKLFQGANILNLLEC